MLLAWAKHDLNADSKELIRNKQIDLSRQAVFIYSKSIDEFACD